MSTGKSLGKVSGKDGGSDLIDESQLDFEDQEQEVRQRLQATRDKYKRA